MGTPLGADYRESVLWHEAVDAAAGSDHSDRALPSEADVVVVGSGYCGLAGATALAGAGRRVVVLDRQDLGWGASTRNGGMVIPELKAGPRTLERRHGPLGLRLHDEVEQAFDHVEGLVSGEAGGTIDCDYQRSGQLYLTHGDAGVERLRRLADEHASIGSAARLVMGADLVAEAGSTLFSAGLVIERTGGLHPAKYHAGLVDRAASAGVSLRPRVAALGIRRSGRGGPLELETDRGTIRCGDVLLATNAHADAVDRSLERRVLPMGSFIIATEPLDPAVAGSVLPTRRMAFDDRNLLWYWRHGPDGRLLFGGRKSLGQVSLPEARDHLYSAMLRVHPQLEGVRVDRVWGGEVALTLDRLPHCGVHDRVWFATGCNGSGVALNTWMGHRMGQAILGSELPAFAELEARPIPLRGLRRMWLPLVGAWFARQDRRDARRAGSAAV